eukprot:15440417-Alexandrium_andersonii.AAC.1
MPGQATTELLKEAARLHPGHGRHERKNPQRALSRRVSILGPAGPLEATRPNMRTRPETRT